jgi:antitoxin VapB
LNAACSSLECGHACALMFAVFDVDAGPDLARQSACRRSVITPFWYDYTMALNIKDPETEQLAADVARLTGESKTAAIRQALRERQQRLLLARAGSGRGDRMVEVLEQRLWPKLPPGVRGTPVRRVEQEAILGYGPRGV